MWESTLILEGKGRDVIDDEEIELCAGQYFVVLPGVWNNFPAVVDEPMRGITVKAPYMKDSKETCETS